MSQYFPPYVVSKNNIKVVLNLSGYAREDDLDYFKGKNLIEKNDLVFVPMNKYLNKISNTESILSWKSMGVSNDVLNIVFGVDSPENDKMLALEKERKI